MTLIDPSPRIIDTIAADTLTVDLVEAFLAGQVEAEALPEPAWGPIGKEVYERTYRRDLYLRDPDTGEYEKAALGALVPQPWLMFDPPANGRTVEMWGDTIRRVVLGNLGFVDEKFAQPGEAIELFTTMYTGHALPAGRHLWVVGTNSPYSRNCFSSGFSGRLSAHASYLARRLFEGGGVGSNYSNDLIAVTPPVLRSIEVEFVIGGAHPDSKAVFETGKIVHLDGAVDPSTYDLVLTVEDTREGWVDVWNDLIDMSTQDGTDPLRVLIDVSALRPFGAPLRTFGGTASGPAPFVSAAANITHVLNGAADQDRRLTSVEQMRIDHEVAASVVAGGARRCLPGYTRINTDRGSLRIDQIKVGDVVATPKGSKKVSAFFDQGRQKMVVIKHALGELECTPNHRVAVYDSLTDWGFKEAQHLTADDHLVWDLVGSTNGVNVAPEVGHPIAGRVAAHVGVDPQVAQRFEGECSVDGCPSSGVCTKTPTPYCNTHYLRFQKWGDPLLKTNQGVVGFRTPELNEDLAWVVGLLHGDGNVFLRDGSPHQVSFAMDSSQPKMIDRLVNILVDITGGKPRIEERPGERCTSVHVGNRRFADWCYENVKQSRRPIQIPEWIFGATADVRWAYVAGLFDADGSCRTRPLALVSTVYHSLVSDLTRLMASLGVAVTSRQQLRPNDWQPIWTVNVVGAENYATVSMNLSRLSSKFEASERTSTGNSGNFGFIQEFAWAHGAKAYGGAKNVILPLGELRRQGYQFDTHAPVRVISVEELPYEEWTYDIEVEDIHQFTAEGLVVHNSARMSMKYWADHDIKEFIHCKARGDHWSTNISVEIDDAFRDALAAKDEHALMVFAELAAGMAHNGEPGFVNTDEHSRLEPVRIRVVNPCSEASLTASYDEDGEANGESCNLGSVNLEAFGTDTAGATRAFELMARFLYRATFKLYPDPLVNLIEDTNRRIGAGFMGLQGWMLSHGYRLSDLPDAGEMQDHLNQFRIAVRESADALADELGTPRPVKVTAIAPTGSISQMFGTQAGGHPVTAVRYIRNVRYSTADAAVDGFRAKGYTVEPDVRAANTVVVSFPSEDVILSKGYNEELIEAAADIPLDRFAALTLAIQDTFCAGADGQAVSATGQLAPGQTPQEVAEMIRPYLRLKGLTSFPTFSMPQMPFEAIDKERYDELVDEIAFYEAAYGDSNDGSCATGACPVK